VQLGGILQTSFNFGKLRFSGVDHSTRPWPQIFRLLDSTVLDTGAFGSLAKLRCHSADLGYGELQRVNPIGPSLPRFSQSRTEPDGQGGGIHIGRVFFAQVDHHHGYRMASP
jgi:hypothetical protein